MNGSTTSYMNKTRTSKVFGKTRHISALMGVSVIEAVYGYANHVPFKVDKICILGNYFRCKIPGLDNDTWDDDSLEHQALVKYYIPPSDTYPYDRCHLYDRSNSSESNGSLVKCNTWVYDTSVFGKTFTTQVRSLY